MMEYFTGKDLSEQTTRTLYYCDNLALLKDRLTVLKIDRMFPHVSHTRQNIGLTQTFFLTECFLMYHILCPNFLSYRMFPHVSHTRQTIGLRPDFLSYRMFPHVSHTRQTIGLRPDFLSYRMFPHVSHTRQTIGLRPDFLSYRMFPHVSHIVPRLSFLQNVSSRITYCAQTFFLTECFLMYHMQDKL